MLDTSSVGPTPHARWWPTGSPRFVDINFGPDGMLHVVEIDEASWFAVEFTPDLMAGGTVNAYDLCRSDQDEADHDIGWCPRQESNLRHAV
jgi:hypothetical protein